MKLRAYLIALHAALLALMMWANPAAAGSMTLFGVGKPSAGAPGYSGPGDSKAFIQWGSVARVYNGAAASTSTQMADLVQGPSGASPGTAVGTLRGSASGLVDLTGYFAGSVTPATACGLITGGCVVSKLYDQVGGFHWTQGTGSKRPTLTFSAVNSLPVMTFVQANSQTLVSSSLSSQSEPYVFEVVGRRPVDNSTKHTAFSNSTGGGTVLWPDFNDAMRAGLASDITTTQTVLDSLYHVAQALFNGGPTSSSLVVDAATFPGDTGTAANLNGATYIGSFGDVVQYLGGSIAEAGAYAAPSGVNAGVQTNACAAYGLGAC